MTRRQALALSIACDSAIVTGAGVLAYGAWLAWAPGGFITGGIALVLLGLLLGRT